MLIDLPESTRELIEADVAVIGAGAAGITVARQLIADGKTVVLLESGGIDHEAASSNLNAGQNVGQAYYDLDKARLHFFGGTTAIWGGRCAELDPIDFEHRPWVEHSGWPFGIDELRPYYDAGRKALDLPPSNPTKVEGTDLFDGLARDELTVRYWLFDRKFDRFGLVANRALVNDPKLTAITHATVREIVPDESGRTVDRLEVRGLGNRQLVVRAGVYVLAAGGIENPRLLLASNSVAKRGLGNDHDLVGRFFMEHPHARGGRLVGARVWRILKAFGKHGFGNSEFAPLLSPSSELQEKLGILNSGVSIASRPKAGGRRPLMKEVYLYAKHRASPTKTGRGVWKTTRRLGRRVKRFTGPIKPWLACATGRSELALVLRAEQAPNPDSRVTLGEAVDATGMPRVRLDWRLKEQDAQTAAVLVDAVARHAASRGLGRVDPAEWLSDNPKQWTFDPLISDHPIGGYHHMGTTRMADDPRKGVTDGYGRVHGLHNLYVVGSSVFPTGGWANPTLTILALSLRTAKHIAAQLKTKAPVKPSRA
jgi:choline dehydrogenase-like flavoprotein